MNPPIRYFGGKSNMRNEIVRYFPDEGSFSTYIEPFGGSYSLGLEFCGHVPNEIYNDLNRNVYSLYSVLQDEELYKSFKGKCDLCVYSEDFRKEYLMRLRSDENLSPVERAFMFWYVNRTSHNGVGGFSVNLVVRRNMSKSVSDMLSAIDRMDELHQRLSKVTVLNRDAMGIIEKYGQREDTFIYCDPPYVWDTRTSARYETDMSNPQHEKFLDICLKSKAKILISGYDHEMYDRLTVTGWRKVSFDVHTVSGNKVAKTSVETLWMNYEPGHVQKSDEPDEVSLFL